jgi:hypothetical protein
LRGVGAAAWPLAARAQQRERIRRIGMLLPAYPPFELHAGLSTILGQAWGSLVRSIPGYERDIVSRRPARETGSHRGTERRIGSAPAKFQFCRIQSCHDWLTINIVHDGFECNISQIVLHYEAQPNLAVGPLVARA